MTAISHINDSPQIQAQSQQDSIQENWVRWFCSLTGNDWYCVIPREFIEKESNLIGLHTQIKGYNKALNEILDLRDYDDASSDVDSQSLKRNTVSLFNLLHARFITTPIGLEMMSLKFLQKAFGVCPRVMCDSQALLPIGQSSQCNKGYVLLYCPKCEDLYIPPSLIHQTIDGAAFGPSFPHLFLFEYPLLVPPISKPRTHNLPALEMLPSTSSCNSIRPDRFPSKIYGFSLHCGMHHHLIRWIEDREMAKKHRIAEYNDAILTLQARKANDPG
ncbi:putative Casein kinase II subunit beta [Blattamonas nauphoetae]|uniref:Casein kinase II subunit beta n=1 Tax=Blattamonas nauphoetae TaxID=2049346 RepID=A0ABQ9YA56_9EUKA|nr:putative Casein kinase II subunit beta [Blattamonas nauphoetae]